MSPLIKLSTSSDTPLTIKNAWTLPESEQMGNHVKKLVDTYSLQKKMRDSKNPFYFFTSLLQTHKRELRITGYLRLLNTLVQAFPALFVSKILLSIENGSPTYVTVRWSAGLFLVLLAKMVTENQYFHSIVQMGNRVRGGVMGAIVDKSMNVGPVDPATTGQADYSQPGTIINLLESDATALENTALQIHTVWDGLLQIAIYITLLTHYLGKSVFLGLMVLLATIPTNFLTLRKLNALRKQELICKDQRTKKINEVIRNIKSVKLCGLEVSQPFLVRHDPRLPRDVSFYQIPALTNFPFLALSQRLHSVHSSL